MGLRHEPLSHEELMKGQLIAMFGPSCFSAQYNLVPSKWELSPLKTECEQAVKYMIRTHVATEKANLFGDLNKESYWDSEVWSPQFGKTYDRSPIGPDCRYMAATLFLADIMVACLCLGQNDGMRKAKAVVKMLSSVQDDANKGHIDKAVVEMLGTFK